MISQIEDDTLKERLIPGEGSLKALVDYVLDWALEIEECYP